MIILGWFGSQQKHLEKYCEAWRRLGVEDVVSYRPSLASVLFRGTGEREASEFLKRQRNVPRKEVEIWHLMSQGGWSFYGSLLLLQLKELKGERTSAPRDKARPLGLQIRAPAALVFDSGPTLRLEAKNAAVGVLSGVFSSWNEEKALDFYSTPPVSFVWDQLFRAYSVWFYGRWASDMNKALDSNDGEVEGEERKEKQLYLYSMEDKVIDPLSIETFAKEQEKLGKVVYTKKWQRGKHVQLLREHRDEYCAELKRLLKELHAA